MSYELNPIKFTDLNKINPNKDKKKKSNPFSKLEEKLESKLIDKFGAITVTNKRSTRYKNTLNSSTDVSSYINNSMNSIDQQSHRSNSEDKAKQHQSEHNNTQILPEINMNMNITTNSSADSK